MQFMHWKFEEDVLALPLLILTIPKVVHGFFTLAQKLESVSNIANFVPFFREILTIN